MEQAGHRVDVLTLSDSNRQDWLRLSTILADPEKRYTIEGVRVHRIGFSKATRLRMLPWTFAYYGMITTACRHLARYTQERIEEFPYTPALIHATRIGREFMARAALDIARKRNIPFVITCNHHPRWKGRLYVEYDKIYREADAVIAHTDAERDTLIQQKGVAPEKVHVVGIGPVLPATFSAETFRARCDLDGQPFVLYLGQQYKYKGIEAILKAAPLVWQRYPDLRFVFAGPPTEESRAVFESVHDSRVLNLGLLDPVAKASALAACEMLCLPSTQESFGGVFVEAWSFRKPVIGGRIPPIAAVIDEGKDGLLASQDPNELAGAMMELMDHPKERAAMGDAGWQKVQENFTWNRLAAKTAEIYAALGA
jgi:glycosyltransferase involved in cell wall biosynthesis